MNEGDNSSELPENISRLEPCNRCCLDTGRFVSIELVECSYCGFSEPLEVWQLRGWRSIKKYPPSYAGTIFVYGAEIGRKEATWNSETQSCSLEKATHWLRTPDPRKQINM